MKEYVKKVGTFMNKKKKKLKCKGKKIEKNRKYNGNRIESK